MKTIGIILVYLLLYSAVFAQNKTRLPFYTKIGNRDIYHLYLADTTVNFTGKAKSAMAINGTIPAPVLEFTEGDTAEIYITNQLKTATSVHWHGLILPNEYDGVSYLTTAPIKAGDVHFYRFPIKQSGTYFYHAHTTTQQQNGLYGAFIIHKKEKDTLRTYNVVISDWTNENPNEVYRSLRNQTDWYAIQKGSVQDYAAAIKAGHFSTKFTNEWKRMQAMDVSDIYYDRFFINGKTEQHAGGLKAGEQVRLHIINGSSSTYFWLTFAGGKLTVVANDGQEVEPVRVDRMIIAVAETYDVIVTVPPDGSYEFLTTSEDRTQSASLYLGEGMKVRAVPLPRLNYFEGMKTMNRMMSMSGQMKTMAGMKMANQTMDMNQVMYPEITGGAVTPAKSTDSAMASMSGMDMKTMKEDGMQMATSAPKLVTLNYGMLRATQKTTLPAGPLKTIEFHLSGNMVRYVWTIDHKTLSESDKILIRHGQNVRMILSNNTMMRHPMHLHGHFFRVLNGQGDYSPLKNTLDIMPMETDTVEFAATESGDWLFHCHILYHNMSGMGRIFSYVNSPENSQLGDTVKAIRKVYADDRKFLGMARVGLESNGSDGKLGFVNTRWVLLSTWHLGVSPSKGYESETTIGRYLDQSQDIYGYLGFDYHYKKSAESEGRNLFGQMSNKDNRKTVIAGIVYTLPLLFLAEARVDGDGKLRCQLSREDVPVTNRLRLNLMVNTDKEYSAGLRYIVTKYFGVSSHYDSDMGLGAGITLNY